MKEALQSAAANWIANVKWFICHRSNEVGAFLLFMSLMIILIFGVFREW